jgi:hypothetical protein
VNRGERHALAANAVVALAACAVGVAAGAVTARHDVEHVEHVYGSALVLPSPQFGADAPRDCIMIPPADLASDLDREFLSQLDYSHAQWFADGVAVGWSSAEDSDVCVWRGWNDGGNR